MTHDRSMLHAHALGPESLDKAKLLACIQACFDCAQTCAGCADVCMSEEMADELITCIHTSLDCFDICATTGKILSRQAGSDTDTTRSMLEACRTACRAYADECGQHASMHRHCELCAEACRRSEHACVELLASLKMR